MLKTTSALFEISTSMQNEFPPKYFSYYNSVKLQVAYFAVGVTAIVSQQKDTTFYKPNLY